MLKIEYPSPLEGFSRTEEVEAVRIGFIDCDGRPYTLVVSVPEDTHESWENGAVAIDLTYPDGLINRLEEVVA